MARGSEIMKIEEVDGLLADLSKEFDVPKPNYCIYRIVPNKRLDPYLTEQGGKLKYKGMVGLFADSCFVPAGKMCFMVLLDKGREISRESVVHEFFHYLRHVRRGYKKAKDAAKEEKEVKRLTNKWLRERLE